MASKRPLFLQIAQRCVSRGEIGRAIVTIVNALRNNPDFMDMYPEALSLLAEILEMRFAEEVHRLEVRFPSFGPRLIDALRSAGRDEIAAELEQSFAAFCIDQSKDARQSTVIWDDREEYCENVIPAPSAPRLQAVVCAPTQSFQTVAVHPERALSQNDDYTWMLNAAHNECEREAVKHERKRETGDMTRSFGRIRTQTELRPIAAEYADNASDRVILDFDNRIPATPKAAMFASSVTKIRTFAEELADYRRADSTNCEFSIKPHDPMERLAETTHALSDTPSVEPYNVRHPLRFHITTQHILACILICGLIVAGIVTWNLVSPYFEQRAIQDVSESYIASAESGAENPVAALNTADMHFVDEGWMNGYRMFLEVWQREHFNSNTAFTIDPADPAFPKAYSSAQAAYITQQFFENRTANARQYYESLPSQVWRDHPYFHLWVQALLDESSRDFNAAAGKYEKLLHSPLAPFALVRMGLMTLENAQSQSEITERFMQAYEKAPMVPLLATCTRHILKSAGDNIGITGYLREPYRQYCAIGKLFDDIRAKQMRNATEYQYLRYAQPLSRGEYYRLEAIIGAALLMQQTGEAAAFYKDLDLPQDHPVRIRLRSAIFENDMWRGNWSGIHDMYPDIPKDIGYLSAARVIDQAAHGTVPDKSLIRRPEALLKYGNSDLSHTDSIIAIDDAYTEAYYGRFEAALSITRALLSSQPDAYEPLFLQAMILSQAGRGREAAAILEQAMMTGHAGAPFIVLSNLYRARAGLRLNASAFVLDLIDFNDISLESAKCEIYWRSGNDKYKSCLKSIENNHKNHTNNSIQSKAAWIILAKEQMISSNSAQWAKAGTGYMSIPGFYLSYARVLLKEDQLKAAVSNYEHAILDDISTATPETVAELEHIYISRKRRIEGSHVFEKLTEAAEQKTHDAALLGALHQSAARLYQPSTAHPMARKHLTRALELLGDNPDTLRGLVDYYEAKEKPDQARKYRARLGRLLNR